jgi:magnesium-protoporphyrin IX monomethyl ester (oxidative) cyclase
MKVLLFDPPYERLMGIKTTPVYPIGLAYLTSYLNKAGHEAQYFNLDFDDSLPYSNLYSRVTNIKNYSQYKFEVRNDSNHYVWGEVRDILRDHSPQIVGISCITLKMQSALKIAKSIKEFNSNIIVILGGHHPQLFASEIYNNVFDIDIIIKNEGEISLLNCVNAIQNNKGTLAEKLKDVGGIFFRDSSNNVIETDSLSLISNLDDLPFPDSAVYIKNKTLETLPLIALMASRGCPYNCNYCATHNIWQNKIRKRSVGNVIDEIKMRIEKQNDRYFYFFDDCFTLNKNWTIEFCDRVIKENLQINWSCISNVNLVDETLFKKMIKAGCTKINLAVESGSERILKASNKNIELDYIRKVFKYTKKYNISTTAYFMIGFPTETIEDIRKTQAMIKELSPNWVYVNVLIPLPPTQYYKWAVDNRLIDQRLAWSGDIYEHLQTNYTGTINNEQFDNLVDETFKLSFQINKKISNLWKRVPLQHYLRNPRKMLSDVGKFISWRKNK